MLHGDSYSAFDIIISMTKLGHNGCDVFKKDTEIYVAVGLLIN